MDSPCLRMVRLSIFRLYHGECESDMCSVATVLQILNFDLFLGLATGSTTSPMMLCRAGEHGPQAMPQP